jgi:membrane-bound lytic murein transglycosylase B
MSSSPSFAPLVEPPPRPPRRRSPKLLVLSLLLGVAAAVFLVVQGIDSEPPARRTGFAVPAIDAEPRATVPFTAPPVDLAAVPDMARRMDIPERVLLSYVKAEQQQRASTPRCGISWTMLAGIGRKESLHARFGGTTVAENGQLSRPIIGVPLNGSPGVRAIADTDRGALDGDASWDRAVGPMQFLPGTWKRWAVRANGDGAAADPQNMDDAAISAARYLCATGRDLTNARGWWEAVLTYNNSVQYGRDVFSGQEAYARAS